MADEFLKDLIELNAEAKRLHNRYLGLKEEASEAKKSWEAKVTAIQEAIDGYGKDYPLFERPGDDKPDDDSGGGWGGDDPGPDGPVSPPPGGGGDVIDVSFEPAQPALPAPAFIQPVPAAFQSEAWRSESLEVLDSHGLSDKLIERMAEAGLKTIGDLANWSNSGKRLTDIDGIGEARADEIESATESYWTEYKARQQASETTAEKPKRSRKKTA